MRAQLAAALLLLSPAAVWAQGALDSVVENDALWQSPAATLFSGTAQLGFRWESETHDSARSAQKGNTLFGIPVYETVVRCEKEDPKEITALFYNRGDAGALPKDQYEALIRRAVAAISTATKAQFIPRGKDASNAVKADGVLWNTAKTTYLLEYSATKEMKGMGIPFRAEFVRLTITPREQPKSLLQAAFAAEKAPAVFRGADHVKSDLATGDVEIAGIPMVDQGQKGYCVVASAERVMRYYGVRVDENELAELANTSASNGTSVKAMEDSLKKLTARLKIRVHPILDWDYRQFTLFIQEYNRCAKHAKAKEIDIGGGEVSLSQIYRHMQPDVLRQARGKNHSGETSFQHSIEMHVDKGIPLLWSVMLGVIPEKGLENMSGTGGHMRLIIGYNQKTNEVLYSDSWGIGHELKRMPLADAWAITTGMCTVEPL